MPAFGGTLSACHTLGSLPGQPASVLRWLVPDIAVGAAGTSPGVSWGAVSALMLMHLAIAAAAGTLYRWLMPAAASLNSHSAPD